jgi:hypothetical protein
LVPALPVWMLFPYDPAAQPSALVGSSTATVHECMRLARAAELVDVVEAVASSTGGGSACDLLHSFDDVWGKLQYVLAAIGR